MPIFEEIDDDCATRSDCGATRSDCGAEKADGAEFASVSSYNPFADCTKSEYIGSLCAAMAGEAKPLSEGSVWKEKAKGLLAALGVALGKDAESASLGLEEDKFVVIESWSANDSGWEYTLMLPKEGRLEKLFNEVGLPSWEVGDIKVARERAREVIAATYGEVAAECARIQVVRG